VFQHRLVNIKKVLHLHNQKIINPKIQKKMKKKFLVFTNRRYVSSVGMPVCAEETLGEVDFDHCDPETHSSEIQRIFLRQVNSTDFTDWTSPAEWNARVSETSLDMDAIRALTVIGDKPAPNAAKRTISGGRTIVPRKEHTINFTVDEATAANHNFFSDLKGGKRYKANYETAGGRMFGGNNGIAVEVMGDIVLARGQGELQVYVGTLFWVSPETEEMCISPIFGETVLGSASLDTTVSFATDATPAVGDVDFILAGGVDPVALFRFNQIEPTIGVPLVMTVKVATVLKLTANMTADFNGQPFIFRDALGVNHSGIIAAGDVNF
jgi:hypothetical protein